MKQSVKIACAILLGEALLFADIGFSQGISRSSGLGVRMCYWNMANRPSRFSVTPQATVVEVSGFGSSLYYFSRVNNNWFFDLSLGTIARTQTVNNQFFDYDVDVTLLVPFLFGVRYDLLSSRVASKFQPYLTAGIGPYFTTTVHVSSSGEEVSGESRLLSGATAGAGINLVLTSWLALNFELKYHFVDLHVANNLKSLHAGDEFSGTEFGLGFCFMWGRKRELFQIKEARVIVKDLYPAYFQFYSTYPLAFVTVKNTAGFPIDINVRSNLRGYSERTKESGFVHLAKGEVKDIPVTAILGPRLNMVDRRQTALLDITVEARAGASTQKEISTQIMVHNRNAWNGDTDKLGFFVTPEDPKILEKARVITAAIPANGDSTPVTMAKARALFEALTRMKIRYQSDPNIPYYKDDRVQFANETLDVRSGDCDDLVVLYSSLLESVGVSTAFVDVQNPEKAVAHLYLMFDTGVPPNEGGAISSNEKRYIIRENGAGRRSIWVPVETTLITHGFDAAWKSAALQYLEDGTVHDGLVEGWMKIVDWNRNQDFIERN